MSYESFVYKCGTAELPGLEGSASDRYAKDYLGEA